MSMSLCSFAEGKFFFTLGTKVLLQSRTLLILVGKTTLRCQPFHPHILREKSELPTRINYVIIFGLIYNYNLKTFGSYPEW